MTGKYIILDHQADARIRAEGQDFAETLRALCLGMWSLMIDAEAVPDKERWEVAAEGDDEEELVVKLLNEHLYRLSGEGLVVKDLLVMFPAPGSVLTRCRGATVRDGVDILREVKAATYNDILITPTLMEVTFDL
ncbi:MAG TPA: archease [Firmicutes bacterium]|nr:archease [Candidatus Fermentithermobacillaceae bacterium]